MRRPRVVRRAAAGADPARRLGLPDRGAGTGPRAPPAARPARGRALPGAGPDPAQARQRGVNAAALGIADGKALGGSYRLIVTRPDRLEAAREALEAHLGDMDLAASRFR